MALSSLSTNISSSATTFTFTTPIKLDRSNYLIWKSQILSSVRANELESLLDGSKICPDQFLSSTQGNSDAIFNALDLSVSGNIQQYLVKSSTKEI